MKGYETVFIADPEISEEDLNTIIEKINKLISEFKGKLIKIERLGKKKLTYQIKKFNRGLYLALYFLGEETLVKEIERIMRFDDKIIRYLTLRKEKLMDLKEETIKEEERKEEESYETEAK